MFRKTIIRSNLLHFLSKVFSRFWVTDVVNCKELLHEFEKNKKRRPKRDGSADNVTYSNKKRKIDENCTKFSTWNTDLNLKNCSYFWTTLFILFVTRNTNQAQQLQKWPRNS